MICCTELAMHTYMILRHCFVRPANGLAQHNGTAPYVPVFDFYCGVLKRPSAFMQHTIERLQKFLKECTMWIDKQEQLVQIDANTMYRDSLRDLPKVMSNVHDYFLYFASKVEKLHVYMESMRTAYLIEQRQLRDYTNSSLEVNHREAVHLEVAARWFHPTLYLHATQHFFHPESTQNPQPTLQQQSSQPAPAGFLTPAPPLFSWGLFSMPSGLTASSAFFGPSAGFTPHTTLFGSASGVLFGSTLTLSRFGSTTPGLASNLLVLDLHSLLLYHLAEQMFQELALGCI